jgi:hypothetical protein
MIGGGWGNRVDGRGINPSWLLKSLDAAKGITVVCGNPTRFWVISHRNFFEKIAIENPSTPFHVYKS